MIAERTLESILVEEGYVTAEQVSQALQSRIRASESVGDLLVRLGLITEVQKLRCIAQQTGIPFFELHRDRVDGDHTSLLPKPLALRHRALVVDASESAVTLVMSNPLDINAIDEIARAIDRDVDPMWCAESELVEILTEIYGGTGDMQAIINEAARDLEASTLELNKGDTEEEAVSVVELREVAEGGPVVQLSNALFAQAIKYRASDIHIEPAKRMIRVRFRIDGVLKDVMDFPREVHRAVVSRIKIVSGLDIAERRMPQDGRCSLVTAEGEFDFRVATYPSVNGEKVCIRVLDKRKSNQEVSKLGIPEDQLRILLQCAENAQGFILVNGPTGSGKTTTLYSLLNHLNRPDRHIITVEDPVEYQLDGIIQANVNPAAGMTFTAGLRAMLRQDPDVILVGESRDPETAKTAIEAALTGHLVMTSLHANDSTGAITRLIEMGIEPFLVGASVTCSVAQRLVRTNCPHCVRPYDVDSQVLRRLGLSSDHQMLKGAGCEKCAGTGYRGRMGIYEVMYITPLLRQLITDNTPSQEIFREALAHGMRPMIDDARAKILSGQTSPDEVLRVLAVEAAA